MEYLLLFCSFIISLLVNRGIKIKERQFRKILITKLDHIGDAITALPAIRMVRRTFPDSYITLMIGSHSEQIFLNNPDIDEIIVYNSPYFCRERNKKTKVLDCVKKMKEFKPDLVIGLRDDWVTLLCSLLYCKARVDRGTVRIRLKLNHLLNKINKRTPNKNYLHEVETNLEVIKKLNIKPNLEYGKTILTTDEERCWAENFLLKKNIRHTDKIAVIHPGAAWKYRRWSPKNFASVGDYLIENYGFKVIVVTGHHEAEIGHKVINYMKHETILLTNITLRNFIALVERVDLIICSDSAPMHIASALDTMVLALFGPNDPRRFGPYGEKGFTIKKEVSCSPCKQVKCGKEEGYRCMDLISVNDVINSLREIIR